MIRGDVGECACEADGVTGVVGLEGHIHPQPACAAVGAARAGLEFVVFDAMFEQGVQGGPVAGSVGRVDQFREPAAEALGDRVAGDPRPGLVEKYAAAFEINLEHCFAEAVEACAICPGGLNATSDVGDDDDGVAARGDVIAMEVRSRELKIGAATVWTQPLEFFVVASVACRERRVPGRCWQVPVQEGRPMRADDARRAQPRDGQEGRVCVADVFGFGLGVVEDEDAAIGGGEGVFLEVAVGLGAFHALGAVIEGLRQTELCVPERSDHAIYGRFKEPEAVLFTGFEWALRDVVELARSDALRRALEFGERGGDDLGDAATLPPDEREHHGADADEADQQAVEGEIGAVSAYLDFDRERE
ncbi:hypothetical protein TMEC50S_00395 [Thauera mechernichensis]